MHTNADKVGEGLSRIRQNLRGFGRTGAEYRWNIDLGIFQNGVGGSDRAEITTGARKRDPRSGSNLALLVDHFGGQVGGAAGGIKERSRPIREGDTSPGRAVGLEIPEAVRHGLA